MFIYTYSVVIPVINSKHTLTILASFMLVAGMPMAFADGHASDGFTITAEKELKKFIDYLNKK